MAQAILNIKDCVSYFPILMGLHALAAAAEHATHFGHAWRQLANQFKLRLIRGLFSTGVGIFFRIYDDGLPASEESSHALSEGVITFRKVLRLVILLHPDSISD